jgi:hypothetical protein
MRISHPSVDDRAAEADRRKSRRLFLVALLMTASLHAFLIADGRLVRGHQTRFGYELQYSVLSACTQSPPFWPAVDPRGLPVEQPVFGQGSLLEAALMLAGSAAANANFLPLFHLGIFFDELLLLLGCWLLSRRFFPSPETAFFVSIAAVGSAFGMDHAVANLRSIAALPLLLYLLHGFLDDGSRVKLFLAANLAVLPMAGSPAGTGLAAPLVSILYFAGRAFVLQEPIAARLKAIAWKRSDGLLGLAIAGAGLPVAIASFWEGSRTAASLRLQDLPVIAGLSNPLKYLDVLAGATPSLDWSMYCGALTLAFAVAAILRTPRGTLVRLAVAIPCALMIVAAVLVLFRPDPAPAVGLPLVRLLLVFVAGAGFQRLLSQPEPEALRRAGGILMAGSLLLALASWAAAVKPDAMRDLLRTMVTDEPDASTSSAALQPWLFRNRGAASIPSELLGASALTAALGGALVLLRGSRPRVAPLALLLLLVLHPLDVFGWKFRMSWLETFSANPEQRELQRLAPLPHPAPRADSPSASPRYEAFHRIVKGHSNPLYVERSPSEIVPAYWGVGTPAAGDRRSPPAFLALLLGLQSLFWILWMLRSAGLLLQRGRVQP